MKTGPFPARNPRPGDSGESVESVYGALVCCGARKMLIGDSIVGSGMTNACSPPADLPAGYLLTSSLENRLDPALARDVFG